MGVPMSDEVVERYLELLIAKDGPLGSSRYRRMPAYPLQALIPDLLYRCRLLDIVGGNSVTLTMFLQLGELGGALWEQEMRILERVHGLAHPSLPTLEDGGYLPAPDGGPGIAYITTKSIGTPGDEADLQLPCWPTRTSRTACCGPETSTWRRTRAGVTR
jgi:hypothetical protein